MTNRMFVSLTTEAVINRHGEYVSAITGVDKGALRCVLIEELERGTQRMGIAATFERLATEPPPPDVAYYGEIERLERDLEEAKRSYLRRWGWKYCTGPGSLWLWSRDFSAEDAERQKWHDAHPTASPMVPWGHVTGATMCVAISMTLSALDHHPGGRSWRRMTIT